VPNADGEAGSHLTPDDDGGGSVSTEAALRRIPTWMVVAIVPAMAVIAVVLTSFVSSDQSSSTGSAAGPDTIVIKNFSFSPKPITVKTGSVIAVVNDDNTTHTLTADNGAFDTGDLDAGRRASVTVDRAGTFRYHCTIHPFMTGTARVSP
jgi:plastocyanin